MKKEVKYTNGIPICPKCNKATIRTGKGSSRTSMYHPPMYNSSGDNINVDRNITRKDFHCNECGSNYSISGNEVNGYKYQ